ncbi:MAG TPA: DinB family protein [Pyrinomonadaceae bacterium]|jgi:uncharacterized damage-inducible protein DinB
MKKTEMIERVHESHERLIQAIDGLSEEQATRKGLNPQWSVKDCLAHVAAWESEGARLFEEMVKGTWKPQAIDKSFIDEFNARAVEARTNRSMREVADEYNLAHVEIERLLQSMPAEIDETSHSYHLIELLTIKHPAHHAAQIEEWKTKVMNDEG